MNKKLMWNMVRLILFAMVLNITVNNVFAQSYPNKPIRILVGFSAGGFADVLARIVGLKLSDSLGQPVVVENRPGAGSNIAAELVAKAPPDGYTLFMYSSVNAVNVTLYSKLSYDTVKDFAPVALFASMANILVVHPSVPAHSVKELIALAKSKPGQLNFASSGYGATQHLSGQLFKTMAGIDIVHIPYKGSVPAMTALVSGEIPMMFNVMSTVLPQMKAGKVRALAVSSAKRSPFVPDLPSVSEAGLPGFEYISYLGALAPAGTPKEIVTKLNTEVAKVLDMPDTKERFSNNGAEIIISTPEQFLALIKEEVVKQGKLVKESGARVD